MHIVLVHSCQNGLCSLVSDVSDAETDGGKVNFEALNHAKELADLEDRNLAPHKLEALFLSDKATDASDCFVESGKANVAASRFSSRIQFTYSSAECTF